MKRIFGVILFLTFSFLINISIAEAKSVSEVCYYKTSDSNFTFAVKAYDDGTSDAILMNPYTEADFGNHQGHKESQDYMATWTDVGEVLNGSTCKQYMKYTVNSGPNSIEFHDSTPSLENNDLLLTNYDFEGQASKCVYEDILAGNGFKVTFLIKDKSLFTYYNDSLNDAMVSEINMDNTRLTYTFNGSGYGAYNSDRLYSDFIDMFYDDTQGCPNLGIFVSSEPSNLSYGSINIRVWSDDKYLYSPADVLGAGNEFPLSLTEYGYKDEITPVSKLKSYTIPFSDGNVEMLFSINSYSDKREKICLVINNSEVCSVMNRDIDQDTPLVVYKKASYSSMAPYTIFETGREMNMVIYKNDIIDIFKYENSDDPTTLIDPGVVYYNYLETRYKISKTGNDDDKSLSTITSERAMGYDYRDKMCQLKPYMNQLSNKNLNYQLEFYLSTDVNHYTVFDLPCADWEYNYTYDCTGEECGENLEYEIQQKLYDVAEYCQGIYRSYGEERSVSIRRVDECISFQNFYQEGVKNNIFADYTNNCGILSKDIRDKLTWILDIIKIAGPILAVGLGTLDFVKVVASGDADKEMKSAFKRFGTRIVAAVLLFLVPVILAFLMDTFLGNQAGYDSDNPFCDIVEFNE